ncbi:MAG TPA: hypothetical protein VGX91_13730 [Candidatus Cybelea sp.]|jgi:hypothetical protein|nr:hypothetical protein [Candidatus Cybelea sp.]
MKTSLRALCPAILAALSGAIGDATVGNPNSTNASLVGIGGDATADVWSVGHCESASSFRTLAERWNGVAWNPTYGPSAGTSTRETFSQKHLSSTGTERRGGIALVGSALWSVGDEADSSENEPLIAHLNPCR